MRRSSLAVTIRRDVLLRFPRRISRDVHVHHSGGEAKFWIEPQIELARNWGLNEKPLREAGTFSTPAKP
jgi:hypothetical protein